MHASALLLGVLAGSVAADILPAMPGSHVEAAIMARGTPECTNAAIKILPAITADVPIPPAALVTFLATADLKQTDPCVDPVITGTMGSTFSEYASSYTSWQNKHLTDFRSLYQACSDLPEVSKIAIPSGACAKLVAQITSKGAAPRETGMVVAAIGMAGLVAAAM